MTGQRYGIEMPVSEQVLKRVLELEPEEGRARADMLRKPEAEMLDDLERDSLVYEGFAPSKEEGEKDTRKRLKIGQKSVRESPPLAAQGLQCGGHSVCPVPALRTRARFRGGVGVH